MEVQQRAGLRKGDGCRSQNLGHDGRENFPHARGNSPKMRQLSTRFLFCKNIFGGRKMKNQKTVMDENLFREIFLGADFETESIENSIAVIKEQSHSRQEFHHHAKLFENALKTAPDRAEKLYVLDKQSVWLHRSIRKIQALIDSAEIRR